MNPPSVASRPDPDAPGRGQHPELATTRRWAGDLAALLLLAGLLWYLEDHDGGHDLRALAQVAVVAALALPVAWVEAARLPRPLRALLAAWGAGALASIAFGSIRSGFQRPGLTLALMPLVFLLAGRVWRRRWGPAVLLGLLAVAAGLYWQRSYLQWWGATLNEQQPVWLALSWHNQSGALMGAFGLTFAGVALGSERVVRVGAVVLSGLLLAVVPLSSSRGALALTVAAGLLLLAGEARRRMATGGVRALAAPAAATAGIALLAVLTAGVLLAQDTRADGATPLGARSDGSAATHAGLRIEHMKAGLGMFASRPLTGTGLGTYGTLAVEHNSPDANLTASAHNEYVEALATGGLALGVPVLALMALLGIGALAAIGRPGVSEPGDGLDALRAPALTGLAAATALLGAHAATDFDWGYPVLPGLLAVGAAAIWHRLRPGGPQDPDDGAPPDRRRGLAVVPVAILLLAVGTVTWIQLERDLPDGRVDAETYADSPLPWDLDAEVQVAFDLLRSGEAALATDVVERGLRWHPGSSRLRTYRAILAWQRGELTAAELAASLAVPDNRFDEYEAVAEQLADAGEYDLALSVLDELDAEMAVRRAWDVGRSALSSAVLRLRIVAADDDCAAAREAATSLVGNSAILPAAATADDLARAAGCPGGAAAATAGA